MKKNQKEEKINFKVLKRKIRKAKHKVVVEKNKKSQT